MKIIRRVTDGAAPYAKRGKRELLATAKNLDSAIRCEISAVQASLSKLAEMLNEMREKTLWTHLVNQKTEEPYRRFEEYVSAVAEGMAHTKLYDLLSISRLSSGPNPVPSQTIEALGRVKAAAIARLGPDERTPALLEEALAGSVPAVKRRVQDILNESLPPDERRDVPIFWGRSYPQQVIDRFEKLEARGCYLEGIRDGDRTLTLRAKFMVALLANFETNFAEELNEADQYLATMEAKKAQSASGCEEREEFDFSEPDESAEAIQNEIGEGPELAFESERHTDSITRRN